MGKKTIPDSVKLRRLFLKDEDKTRKTVDSPKKYRYIKLELSWDKVPEAIKKYQEKIDNNPYSRNIKIEALTKEKMQDFVRIYNRILLTSPDPYREMRSEEGKFFEEGTFLASLWWQPVGFMVLTVEHDEKGELVGVIAGLGVDYRHRRKGIGLALGLKSVEYFAEKKVKKLICEVYDQNETSQRFIKSFGFKESGEIYIC
ncbi:MAG: GNAT family N-acetyltransferase [Candidatus Hermodarchaeota archaeon]